ncbi:MAG: hypothetical protein ACREV6_21385 [Clostridium sp.]|uniref:hypothetical protein n=1 Tax=Clostridium sp. TaxID=1506 RepID=UPI003D6D127A
MNDITIKCTINKRLTVKGKSFTYSYILNLQQCLFIHYKSYVCFLDSFANLIVENTFV